MSSDARLSKGLFNLGNYVHYSDDFRDVLLAHKEIILKRRGTSSISITQQEADKWYGDFYGLLITKGIPVDKLWLITILNGLNCSSDYNSDFLNITTPDPDYIDRLIDIYNTKHT